MSTVCQKDRPTDKKKDRKTFQLSYRNKLFRMSTACQNDGKKADSNTDSQIEIIIPGGLSRVCFIFDGNDL